jgi:PAS domain S-box-containing protein
MSEGFAYHRIILDERGNPCDYVFLEVNEAFERLTGLKAQSIIGRTVTEILPGIEEDPTDWIGKYGNVALTGEPTQFESYSKQLDLWFSVSAFSPQKGFFAVTFSDISKRKAAEEALHRQSAVLAGVNRVLELALGRQTEEGMCEACLDEVEEATGSNISFMGELGSDGFLRDLAISNSGWDACKMQDQAGHRKPPDGFPVRGIYGRVLFDGKGLIVNDPASYPDPIGLPPGHPPLTSFLGVPLVRKGKTVGIIAVGNRKNGYRIEDQHTLEAIAPAIVEALDRKRSEVALRQSREDLNRAEAVGQIGWWRLDIRRNILTWSKENCLIFGARESEPQTYETFLETVHPDDRKYVDTKWKAALRGEPYEIEHRILVGDQVKWVREKAFLEFNGKGEVLGGFGISQDITERRKMEEELRRSRDELEFRVKERTDKLSRALRSLNERSRQVRQMTAELTLTEQRERRQLAQMLHDGLQQLLVGAHFQLELMDEGQSISEGISQLRKILNEAIDASRSLAMELHPPILERNDLWAAIKWLGDWMHKTHGLRVHIKSPQSIQPLNHEILIMLFQSVRELLFNVVKHAGVKRASVELNRLDEKIALTVKDNGGGFDPIKLRMKGGASGGFGLFSMRERLAPFNIRIEIQSAPGKGSRIKLLVPLPRAEYETIQESGIKRASDDRAASPNRDSKQADTARRIRIMLADDQDVVRQGIASLLSRESDLQIVGEASNGRAAIRLARQVQPDVVLMDINMPIMDGLRATHIIHKEFADVQIIGLSVFEDELHINDMLKAGAAACYTKSGPAMELIELIRSCAR